MMPYCLLFLSIDIKFLAPMHFIYSWILTFSSSSIIRSCPCIFTFMSLRVIRYSILLGITPKISSEYTIKDIFLLLFFFFCTLRILFKGSSLSSFKLLDFHFKYSTNPNSMSLLEIIIYLEHLIDHLYKAVDEWRRWCVLVHMAPIKSKPRRNMISVFE